MAAKLETAISLHRRGLLDQAEPIYREILQALPQQPEALHYLGVIHHQRGDPTTALELISRAIAINPQVAGYHANLGIALLRLGQTTEALASLDQAIRLNPALADAHYNRARTLCHLKQPDAAIAAFRQTLALAPGHVPAAFELGNLLAANSRYAEAAEAYRQAIALQPSHAVAHGNLGAALLAAGNPQQAVDHLRRAITLDPLLPDAHYNLGGALLKLGDQAGAVAAFDATLRHQPENSMALHLRNALTGNTTAQPPAAYVEKLFDGYAERFDSHLTHALDYRIPEELVSLLGQLQPLPQKTWRVLDLGCGTGLAGQAFAAHSRELVGVDLSSAMLARAAERKIYACLQHGDLLTLLRAENAAHQPRYDIIVAADVLVYLGDLQPLVAELRQRLATDGYFLFSVESLDALGKTDGGNYQLNASGRYAHARSYLERLAETHGFRTRACISQPVRTENGRAIQGWTVIWQS